MKYLFPLAIAGLAFGCNNAGKASKSTNWEDPVRRDSIVILDSITEMDSASVALPRENIIHLSISTAMLPVINMRKTFTTDAQLLYVVITNVDIGSLRFSIRHSKPEANIRINQLIRPDGTTDGPLGNQVTVDIKQQGDYVFVIGKSNMASGSQVGDVFISVER